MISKHNFCFFLQTDELDCDRPPCVFGACSQKCDVKQIRKESSSQTVNTQRTTSSALCSCVAGYSLEAKKTCKAKGRNATLIVANENVLRHIHPFAFHKMVELNPEKVQQGSKIESIDVFYIGQDSVILWSVKEEGAIYFQRGRREKRESGGSSKNSGILVNNLVLPHGISVDWITRNVYFIHGPKGGKKVSLINFSSRLRKDLAIEDLDEPQDLVVDPESGKMFISDSGSNAKIWSASLDGSKATPFIESKVLWPCGLALDYPARRLYWTDLKSRTIESIELTGRQRKKVKQFHPKEGKPHNIEIFETFIYYSTYQHNKIMKINKFGKGNVTEIAEEVTRVSDLSIMQEFKQDSTIFNPCASKKCQQESSICVIIPGNEGGQTLTGKCICAQGFEEENCTKSSGISLSGKPDAESLPTNLTCDNIKCNNGICKMTDGKTPKCKCEPLFKGDFCDTYICSGCSI